RHRPAPTRDPLLLQPSHRPDLQPRQRDSLARHRRGGHRLQRQPPQLRRIRSARPAAGRTRPPPSPHPFRACGCPTPALGPATARAPRPRYTTPPKATPVRTPAATAATPTTTASTELAGKANPNPPPSTAVS